MRYTQKSFSLALGSKAYSDNFDKTFRSEPKEPELREGQTIEIIRNESCGLEEGSEIEKECFDFVTCKQCLARDAK